MNIPATVTATTFMVVLLLLVVTFATYRYHSKALENGYSEQQEIGTTGTIWVKK